MQELLEKLDKLWRSGNVRSSSDWPKNPQSLSVKLRQLAPLLRSIGVAVEFQREPTNRFVTIAVSGEHETALKDHRSSLMLARVKAYLKELNRDVSHIGPTPKRGATATK